MGLRDASWRISMDARRFKRFRRSPAAAMTSATGDRSSGGGGVGGGTAVMDTVILSLEASGSGGASGM